MSENNDKKDVIFSPAIPRPLVVDIAGRIKRLQDYLDPKNPMYQPEAQHDNIRTAIRLYEEGKLDGNGFITITDGKVGTLEAAFKSKTPSWGEGTRHQYAQKFAYGHGPFGDTMHEAAMEQNWASSR